MCKKRKIDFHPAQSGGRMIINDDKNDIINRRF